MKNLQPLYRDVQNWVILDSKVIHDFSESENPINVVKVLIGKLLYEDIGISHEYEQFRTPIIRWMSLRRYEQLLSQAIFK